ncbi:hypothetical protein K458DRAFT_462409 [Lentithecium fluviatile CBS 122367]|uniref:Uncharacterized protein n=1 Tax=Lentithecium fluviatile CBS 122367 TaxID=1168545 RepID=A0A6G1JFS7_9PLEO|nr:hypothetical protein K458DRAFT_462409 [Lentithecium fluviatile CBS 122367]
MATLGVLTAMVSVIRICGGPVLRAFVGRAQEGAGIAEAELCSSTGRDVCEMYKLGAVTRVFGRPKILEFVHDPHEANFYQKTAEDGQDREEFGDSWDESRQRQDEFAPNPNLMLNIGFKAPSKIVLRLVALFAILLQSSVVAFAVIVQKYLKITREGRIPPPWALPTTIVGTILLCTGMGLCAFLIDQTTMEQNDRRQRSPHTSHRSSCRERLFPVRSVLHWIQPGGQVIGDQTFDSFDFNDGQEEISHFVSSWRRRDEETFQDSLWTWISITITTLGFIVQFLGIRSVHSTVAVYQLGAVLVMSIIRGLLRRRRTDLDKNEIIPRHELKERDPRDYTRLGHELDWLSYHLLNRY